MNHIICPICHEFADEVVHNKIQCTELSEQSKVVHKFSYNTNGEFYIILILRKKYIISIGNTLYKDNFGFRINKFLSPISSFDYCESLNIINKILKNKSFI